LRTKIILIIVFKEELEFFEKDLEISLGISVSKIESEEEK
jgi:hypothetical protein